MTKSDFFRMLLLALIYVLLSYNMIIIEQQLQNKMNRYTGLASQMLVTG